MGRGAEELPPPLLQTLLKDSQESAIHSPSHDRVGTHTQPQKEHPLFTQKSKLITGRCPSLFYLQKQHIVIHLIEETHTQNFYFVVSSLKSPFFI